MTATLRFMDSPATTGAVRLDLNPDRRFYPADLDPGVPSMEGDPDGVGVEYGFRTVSWTQVVLGSKMDALQAQSQLARELLRRENWLQFQVDPTLAPVWFKTYRTEPGSLSLEHVYEDGADIWQIAVAVTADPFAYGERVTLASSVTIKNDPAASPNPVSYVLPDIKGDAPTPLALAANPDDFQKVRAMFSSIADDGFTGPYVWQSGSFTAATADTTLSVSDATFSGGSYSSVSFATSTSLSTRLSGVVPVKPPRGRYKILARVARSDTSSVFDLRFGLELADNSLLLGSTVRLSGTSDSSAWATLVDLGEFNIPASSADEVPHFLSTTTFDQVSIVLQAGRVSGTGSLRVDYFLAVPVEVGDARATTLVVESGSYGLVGYPYYAIYADGDIERVVYGGADFDWMANAIPPTLLGAFPVVTPGRKNILHVLPHVDATARTSGVLSGNNNDEITALTYLRVSYQPRYLYLGA